MTRFPFTFAAVALAFLAVSPGQVSPAAAKEAAATRIVSIGSAVTETIFALGEGDRVVAVDTTSTYPAEATKLPNVGYMRALAAEGVLSMQPDLIVADADSGPVTTIDALKAAGVRFEGVPLSFDEAGVLQRIARIGAVLGAKAATDRLTATVKARFSALAELTGRVKTSKRIAFVLSLQSGRPMVAGTGTAADGIIALAGGVNAFADFEGYKPVADEAVLAAAPDVVLMMNRQGHTIEADELFAMPAFRLVPAAKERSLVRMDGSYLLGFGPRTAEAAHDLALTLYPDLKQGE